MAPKKYSLKPELTATDFLDKEKIITEINTELNSGKEINALFLIHGYVEACLFEILYLKGAYGKKEIPKRENIERMSFFTLNNIHLLLGNIKNKLYSKLEELNKKRNDFAHEIIKIDINNSNTKNKIKNIVVLGINVFEEVFDIYHKILDGIETEIKKDIETKKIELTENIVVSDSVEMK